LHQRGKQREKVSVAAALWWDPQAPRGLGLYYETLVNGYYNNQRMAGFLERLMRKGRQRVSAVWDGGGMHKGDPIHAAQTQFASRLQVERLPPYAPMLNPVEPLWSWLKHGRLANYAPPDAATSDRRIHDELDAIRCDQGFLRSMWQASELPLPRALLL